MLVPQFQTVRKNKDPFFGIFMLSPLEQGYGHTVGNALRRCLLSSIKGRAITSVKINGVKHQFSTLSGMKEDVIELILNLKQVVVKADTDEPVTLKLIAKGPKKVTAKDIVVPPQAKIVNPDLVLANLADSKSKLDCELYTEVGFGFSAAEERKITTLGVIPVDASFSSVVAVNYQVESTRVGRRTDFDRLLLEIRTNGVIDPKKALLTAAETLVSYFKQIYNPVFPKKEEVKVQEEGNMELLNLTVEELDLPTRIANALRKGGFLTVRDLTKTTLEQVSKVKNLGGKSLSIIKDKLAAKGVTVFQS